MFRQPVIDGRNIGIIIRVVMNADPKGGLNSGHGIDRPGATAHHAPMNAVLDTLGNAGGRPATKADLCRAVLALAKLLPQAAP